MWKSFKVTPCNITTPMLVTLGGSWGRNQSLPLKQEKKKSLKYYKNEPCEHSALKLGVMFIQFNMPLISLHPRYAKHSSCSHLKCRKKTQTGCNKYCPSLPELLSQAVRQKSSCSPVVDATINHGHEELNVSFPNICRSIIYYGFLDYWSFC